MTTQPAAHDHHLAPAAESAWGPELLHTWLARREVVRRAGEMAVVTDVQGRILAVSASATAVLGRAPRELVGRYAEALWSGTRDAGRPARVERFRRLRRMAGTLRLVAAGGELVEFDYESLADRPTPGVDLTIFRRRVVQRPTRALTEREHEVIRLACAGMSNEGIAEALGLSTGVVRNRRQRAYQKLHAAGLGEACRLVGSRPTQG